MLSPKGRVVMVSGANRGIGRAIAEHLRALGYRLSLGARRPEELADLATGRAANRVLVARYDARQPRAATRWVGETIARFGRLDGLVNNAGVGTPGDVEQTSFAEWRRVMAVNADGVFLGCKYAMPLLARSKAPSIVNISSASGIVGGANLAAYNASKGAVRLLTKSVALHGARKRPPVRCNSVHPAFIDGDMVDALVKYRPDPDKAMAKLVAQIPIGRLGQPTEVANTVVWLLSPASSFTTGSEVLVDGGLIAG